MTGPIVRVEESMRVEAMGIRPADRLVLDRNDPQLAFHLHRNRELADRLEKVEGIGTPHEVIEWRWAKGENNVAVSIRIDDDGPDVWIGFHTEVSLSVLRLVKSVLKENHEQR